MRPVEERGNDEISALARSFNTMAERVHDAHVSLEQRVADQTADLRQTNDELQREAIERKRAENAAAARSAELEQQTIELEKSRRAAMAMMEDAEAARKIAEAAQEELHDNQERLQAILDTIQAGVVVIEEEGHTIVDANSAALAMIGASKEEVVGRVCHNYICPAEVGRCPISDLGQEIDNSERVLLRADGQTIPVLKTVTPMILDGRRHLLDSFVDITALKRAEGQLQEAKEAAESASESLRETVKELETFNQLAVGRELKMIELKQEVNELLVSQGGAPKFEIVDEEVTA